jgi:mRNA interferase RelE/StbE
MEKYNVIFRKSVASDLRRIPNGDIREILIAIESLSEEPRRSGIEKLSERERYRMRQGNYRILYEINDDEIFAIVVKIGAAVLKSALQAF